MDHSHQAAESQPQYRFNLKKEFLGGFTTFLAMAYIVVVNPSILASAGIPHSGAVTATVLLCFVCTLMMGIYAKLPYAVAPGMGINAFFTYSLVLGQKIPWQTGLGIIFWAGLGFLILSISPVRESIAKSFPPSVRTASTIGIGMFLTLVGLHDGGIIEPDQITVIRISSYSPKIICFILGFLTIIITLKHKKAFSFLLGILVSTIVSIFYSLYEWPHSFFSTPDFHSTFFKFDALGALKISLIPSIFSIVFTDLFDSISTFVGVSQTTKLLDKDGHPKNLRQGLIVDAWATTLAGVFGTSSGTAYIESTAGIEAGGRTGLASVFTAILFLPCLFLAPLAGSIPNFATAPVLVVLGALMFRSIIDLKVHRFEDLIPSFLTLAIIPLTFSITQGLIWGILSHILMYTISGRRKEISLPLWIIGSLALLMTILSYT